MFGVRRPGGGRVLAFLAAGNVGGADTPDGREGWRAGCHYCDVAFVAKHLVSSMYKFGCHLIECEGNLRVPDPEIDGKIYSNSQ